MSSLLVSEKNQLVSDHVKVKFLNLVLGQNLHPQDASERIGVPYPLLLALRGTPQGVDIEIAWRHAEDNKTLLVKSRRDPRKSSMSLTVDFTRRIMQEERGLASYVLDMVDRAWEKRETGIAAKIAEADEDIHRILKRRVLSDVLVKATVTQTQEIKADAQEEFDSMSDDELDSTLERIEAERLKLEETIQRAQKERAVGTDKVQDAVYEYSNTN